MAHTEHFQAADVPLTKAEATLCKTMCNGQDVHPEQPWGHAESKASYSYGQASRQLQRESSPFPSARLPVPITCTPCSPRSHRQAQKHLDLGAILQQLASCC